MKMLPKLTFIFLLFNAFFLNSWAQHLPPNKISFLVLKSFESPSEMNVHKATNAFTSIYLNSTDQNERYVKIDIYSDSSAAMMHGGDIYQEQFRVNGSAEDSPSFAIMAEWQIGNPSKEEAFLKSRNDLFNLRKQYINSFSFDILLKNLSKPGRFLIIGSYSSEEGLRLARSHPEIQKWNQQINPDDFSARDLYSPRVYKISGSLSSSSSFSKNENLYPAREKEFLINGLQRTRKELINEILNLSEQQWNFKEEHNRWSIAEIVEHLFAQNESYRIEMRTALNQPPSEQFVQHAKGNDKVFIDYATDTLKADAGFLSPIGRFCTKEKAMFAFNRTQDALVQLVSGSTKDFRKHFTFRNFVFDGHLSNAEVYNVRDMHQLMLTCISHADRHLNQLRKLKQHPAYPR
jgi:quinol monooxygenase YgiN